MKVSRYTFLYKSGSDRCYLYNTLSNALMQIDNKAFEHILSANGGEILKQELDDELWTELAKRKFITENDKDDYLLYKSMIMPLRAQTNFMHLTIAPTMECNFKCFYCFETEKQKGKMSEETMDSIVKYVMSAPNLSRIYLTWFGGEPLLAVDEMETFHRKLTERYDKSLDSNIITTGYHLDGKAIDVFKKIKISSVQITLDGNKEQHNKVKHIKECQDVFGKVLNNIDNLVKEIPEINVSFRINLTKQNAGEYVSLYRELSERYKNKNVTVSPAFVKNKNGNARKEYYFNEEEISKYVLNLWDKKRIYTPWIRYPSDTCNECAIRDTMAMSFDPQGYAYKCWEVIGRRNHAIGKLQNDGTIAHVNRMLLNRQLYGADIFEDPECSKCEYLPICHGGCPIERLQNEYENSHNELCTPYKGHIADFLKIHIELIEAGYINH